MLSQVRRRVFGSCASARQKLLTKSDCRVLRISANTARASGESSSSESSFTVAMALPQVVAAPAVIAWTDGRHDRVTPSVTDGRAGTQGRRRLREERSYARLTATRAKFRESICQGN